MYQGYERVAEALQQHLAEGVEGAAQVSCWVDGECVVDIWALEQHKAGGEKVEYDQHTMQMLFSTTKGAGCYFLVFVQLFEKYGTSIERNTALIEKVSPCSARVFGCGNARGPRAPQLRCTDCELLARIRSGVLLSRFCATIREIRDFNREKYGTNRESVALQVQTAKRASPSPSSCATKLV
eukprot:SAG31_NODE_870_length_11338_cov_14.525047_7_plen_182_part_00